MSEEFLELGKDLDDMVMRMDTRSLKEQILDWIRNYKEKKWPLGPTTLEEEHPLEEPDEQD